MARSLVRLSGHRRVASALGVGLLVGSLALVGCSSGSPKGGGTVPPFNTAGSGTGSSASASASGGASAGASGAASAGAVTAESLSDPALGYTVVSIPKDLDATQTQGVGKVGSGSWLGDELDGAFGASEQGSGG